MSYTKLDCGITESTIWQAPDTTRLVWITMLARADQNGYVGASMPGLAGLARVSLDACIAAIALLEAPDEWSRTKEHEGRRIAPAEGGWVLLNYAKHRAQQNADTRRERSRVAMAALRAKRKQALTVNTCESCCPELPQAEAEAEEESLSTETNHLSTDGSPPTHVRDNCPHLEILKTWEEVLPDLPAHDPKLWNGTRKVHLRARWRELDVEKHWKSEADGIAYFRELFKYIGRSRFLTGKVQSTGKDGRPAFQAELEWVIKPANWAKIHEGKYHA